MLIKCAPRNPGVRWSDRVARARRRHGWPRGNFGLSHLRVARGGNYHPADGILTSHTYYICTLLLIILGVWDAEQWLPEEMMNTEETIMEEIKGLD